MDLLKSNGIVLVLFFMAAVCGSSCKASSVYKVGDNVGWAIVGNVDYYNKWASSKTFQVGDTIVFEYDSGFHNVLLVSRSDFHSCNVAAPVSTYVTGNDSIVIPSSGHYYYICGFVGHCVAGQKVDIRVTKSRRPAMAPILSPIQAPHGTGAPENAPIGLVVPSPSPTPSGGESLLFNNGLFSCNIGLLLIFLWVFN